MQLFEIILNLFDGDAGAAAAAEGAEGGETTNAAGKSSEAQRRGRELGLSEDLLADYEKAFYADDDAEQDENTENTQNTQREEEDDTEDLNAEFEELIKGKYKDAFKRRTQGIVSDRLQRAGKEADELKSRAVQADKIMTLLASKYGKDGIDDLDGLYEAVKGDNDTWRQRALDSGRSVEELVNDYDANQKQNAMEQELESLRSFKRETELRQRFDRLIDQTKETYPGFDPEVEFDNPKFTAALDFIAAQREAENKAKGTDNEIYDLQYAYELAHSDELRESSIKRAVKATSNAVARNIQANRSRPAENAARRSGQGQAKDFFEMSDSDFDRLVEKIRNGEARI